MIMINSNSAQKVGKPPPPVPPRPSKSVVAEALAKSRHHNKVISIKEAEKTKSPTRQAPPPPTPRSEIAKSKSTYSVNVTLKKPVVYERSISEDVKNTSRPVIYQSSNVKCNNNNNNNGVQVTRVTSDVKIVNNNASNFRNRQGVQLIAKQEKLEEVGTNRIQLFRKESVKREKEFIEKHEGSDGKEIFELQIDTFLGLGFNQWVMMVHLENYIHFVGFTDNNITNDNVEFSYVWWLSTIEKWNI